MVGPSGLAGWLIVLIVVQVRNLYSVLAALFQNSSLYFNPENWQATITSADAGKAREWVEALAWVEFFALAAVLANLIVLLPLFIKEHRAMPKLVISSYVMILVVNTTSAFYLHYFEQIADADRASAITSAVMAIDRPRYLGPLCPGLEAGHQYLQALRPSRPAIR